MIEHVRSKVELKRRRHKIRYFDSSFTGTDAVDVVLHFLLSDTDTFSADLSREKAVKVCQMLIQRKVFQSATEKQGSEKALMFEDSSSKLFQFIGEYKVCVTNGEEEDDDGEEGSGSSTDVQVKAIGLPPRLEKIRLSTMSNHSLQSDDDLSMPELSPNLLPLREILPNGCSTPKPVFVTPKPVFSTPKPNGCHDDTLLLKSTSKSLTSPVVTETWKEVALTQLLTLVDLTFLDGILSEDKQKSKHQKQHQHCVISNIMARNWHLPLTPSRIDSSSSSDLRRQSDNPSSDPMIKAAIECIDCLPKGTSLLNEPVFRRCGIEAKHRAKDIIIKHYTGMSECLLPDKFMELHTSILNLLLVDNKKTALSALQLYMIVLPMHVREELNRLIKFMLAVAGDKQIKLDVLDSNEFAILSLLSSSILQHKLLANNLIRKLVQFLMTNVDCVFTIPRDVRKKVAARLHEIKTGKPLLGVESSFCSRVSVEEFERQSKDCTEESLIDLMNTILDDVNLSLKEKKQKLKAFHKSYPHLYEQHFNGMM